MSFASSLKSFFGLQPDGLRQQAAALYSQLVAQARDPWLYREAAVPDTLDGRFEMIVLQLFCFIYGGSTKHLESRIMNQELVADRNPPASVAEGVRLIAEVSRLEQEQLKDLTEQGDARSGGLGRSPIQHKNPTEQGDARSVGFGAVAPFKKDPTAQAVMEIMIDDMDRNLREMGVGDMGVSRRIKHMGNAINGRLQAYFQAAKDGGWEEALRRNVYATQTPELVTDAAVQALCGYVRERLQKGI